MSFNFLLVVQFLLVSLAAGITGTLCMTFFMHGFTRSGLANANMIEAIGSIFTKSENNALLVGGILHLVSGVIFAMIYALLLALLGVQGTFYSALVGLCIGAGHGFVLAFLLVVAVAEHHPLEKYREAGLGVAAVHFLGHIIYGAIVGTIVGYYHLPL